MTENIQSFDELYDKLNESLLLGNSEQHHELLCIAIKYVEDEDILPEHLIKMIQFFNNIDPKYFEGIDVIPKLINYWFEGIMELNDILTNLHDNASKIYPIFIKYVVSNKGMSNFDIVQTMMKAFVNFAIKLYESCDHYYSDPKYAIHDAAGDNTLSIRTQDFMNEKGIICVDKLLKYNHSMINIDEPLEGAFHYV